MALARTKPWIALAVAAAFALPVHAHESRSRDPAARAAPVLMAQAKPAAKAAANPARAQTILNDLIKGAKAEGDVTFYTAATENVGRRVADAFTAKYGIKAAFVRL